MIRSAKNLLGVQMESLVLKDRETGLRLIMRTDIATDGTLTSCFVIKQAKRQIRPVSYNANEAIESLNNAVTRWHEGRALTAEAEAEGKQEPKAPEVEVKIVP